MPGIVYFDSKSTSGAGEDVFFGTLSDSILLWNSPQQTAMIWSLQHIELRLEENKSS